MPRHASLALRALTITALLLVAALTVAAQSQGGQRTSLDGKIVTVGGNTMEIDLADGSRKKVSIPADTLILARQAVTLRDIGPGDALGVAARRGSDGSLLATRINIFSPELWQRVRKGQFPMQSGQIMTNAVVTQTGTSVDGTVLHMNSTESEVTRSCTGKAHMSCRGMVG